MLFSGNNAIAQKTIKHFVFFNMDRQRIHENSFLETNAFVGAQLKYSWKELEPSEDQYEFSEIRRDLDFLIQHNKKLFIQLQDVTFDTVRVFVPEYLTTETIYGGGVNIQYLTDDNDSIIRQDGYVARRWDKNVADRFQKLLVALAKEFDGKIEGINFPETAVGFGEHGKLYPEGFNTYDSYGECLVKVGKVEDGVAAYKKSLELNPNNDNAKKVIAELEK